LPYRLFLIHYRITVYCASAAGRATRWDDAVILD
jgi:hypothetical protein